MKVKAINRSEEGCTRERAQDVQKVHRNLDPALHPFEKAKEYTRALNAAKLDRVFAKPFLAALPHDDGITCLARNPRRLNSLLSGAADGDVRLWDIPARRCLRRMVGHTAAIKGISVTPDGEAAVSCSTDCTVKLWKVPFAPFDGGPLQEDSQPVLEFSGRHAFRSVDHHWGRAQFATAGAAVEVWDHERSEPVQTFSWGADTLTSVRFNPAEPDVFATAGSDRGVALYDLRSSTPIRKLVMQTRTNALAWNPMEAFNFTVRIFTFNGGHSRDVYHTKRMQRVFAVRFSGDGTYVFSGSDDMNVRVWKANASEQLGTLLPRERKQLQYNKALVERHKHLPEVARVVRNRHLPAPIYKAAKLRRVQQDSERRKTQHRIAHSAPGSVKVKPARRKKVVAELE
ncbi:hypothetical protein CHLNCDRAFT_139585 [Chlorella variabilis]|uniref:DDB1- and CUL4-associated factor 13 n=1 Tax=Chlorella variabilis TaxID=554065 RepID=E1ZQG8_CHLVA|nr:hypothetical protein CHLNCDRAFT_139585 [Chlorella variabilis]EFN52020.1 hypothetical protein CHLNCDRAFT_139585 [Chlorella variabilis]|eukprot:XP_005844122.1 hypothetical protein CHLNCDRAFT_139585 [Chlorella variabilis]